MHKQIELADLKEIITKIEGFKSENIQLSTKLRDLFLSDKSFGAFENAIKDQFSVEFESDENLKDRTLGEWISKINQMISDNEFILSGKIDWNYYQKFLIKEHGFYAEEPILKGTTEDFCAFVFEEGIHSDSCSISDIFMPVIDSHYLTLSKTELITLNRESYMENIYTFLSSKLQKRKPNDCRVCYGNSHPLKIRLLTKKMLGKSVFYPEGISMKHINGHSGVISRVGKTFSDGTSPVPPKGSYCIKGENLQQDFVSLDEMLEAGWVID
ncbi:MAG: hypothetical protein PF518_08005 [Spirochaetaceae bacterium]|jgi:hypothetical protein|nr:hypothetical protein [Spirochaetaceae bacterium]